MQLLRVLLQANKNNLSLFTASKFSQPQTLSHQKIYYKYIMTYRTSFESRTTIISETGERQH